MCVFVYDTRCIIYAWINVTQSTTATIFALHDATVDHIHCLYSVIPTVNHF